MNKKSSKLDEKDYLDLLNGKKNGSGYHRNYFVIKQEKNPTKAEILLNGRVGFPPNMDEEHEKNYVKPAKRKKKIYILLNFYVFLNNRKLLRLFKSQLFLKKYLSNFKEFFVCKKPKKPKFSHVFNKMIFV